MKPIAKNAISLLAFTVVFILSPVKVFAANGECVSTAFMSDAWRAGQLYHVSKIRFFDAKGETLDETRYRSGPFGNDENGRVGNYDPAVTFDLPPGFDSDLRFTYQVFNLTSVISSPPTSVIVEIKYGNFEGSVTDLFIKQLSIDRGVNTADRNRYAYSVEDIVSEIEQESPTYRVSIRNELDQYCQLNERTVRFEVEDLESATGEQAVFAIVVPSDKTASFSIEDINLYDCKGNGCVTPVPPDTPELATTSNCIGIDSGELVEDVPHGTNLHFLIVAPPVTPVVHVRKFWSDSQGKFIAPQFTVQKFTVDSAIIEFSSGTTLPLPSDCKFIAAQNDLGSQNAVLKSSATYEVRDIRGRLLDIGATAVIQKWEWTVQESTPTPLKKTVLPFHSTSIQNEPPTMRPTLVRSCTVIHVRLSELGDIIVDQDLYVENGARLMFEGPGIVEFTNNAKVFLSGRLVTENGGNLQIDPANLVFTGGTLTTGDDEGIEFTDLGACEQFQPQRPHEIVPFQLSFLDDQVVTPGFQIHTEPGMFFAVEITTDNRLFNSEEFEALRTDQNFFNSFWGGSSGSTLGSLVPPLQEPASNRHLTYYVPQAFWQHARKAPKIFYRAIIASDEQGSNAFFTIADDAFQTAPSFQLFGNLNGQGCIDRDDLNMMLGSIRSMQPDFSFDLNGDRKVNIADARKLVTLFTNPRGAPCRQ